jgi:predicted nuclease with TOPRIM domain
MGAERRDLPSLDEGERRNAEILARSERLGGEYDELLSRARRLLAEQRTLVTRFRRVGRKRR